MRHATPIYAPGDLSDGPGEPIPVDGLTPDELAANARQRILAREGRTHHAPSQGGGASAMDPGSPKIRSFDQGLGKGSHADNWSRTPNITGVGAVHVKSFHCKLATDSLAYLDQQINEWLDANPEYEVKFVSTAQGEWIGKTKETHLVVQVWV